MIRRELEEEDRKLATEKKKREEEAAQRLKALQGNSCLIRLKFKY